MQRKFDWPVVLRRASSFCALALPALAQGLAPLGQGELTLSEAVSTAKQNSPRVERARAAAKEAQWRRVGTLSGFLPTLTLDAYHYMGINYQVTDVPLGPSVATIPTILPSTTMALNANLPLFDGFQNVRRYSAAHHEQEAAEFEARWSEFQVAQEVRLKFYQALAANQLALVNDKHVKTLEDHLQKMRAQKKSGVATNYDVLRVEVQLDEARTEKQQAEDNVYLSRTALNELLNLDDDERALTGSIPEPRKIDSVDLNQPAWQDRGDLRSDHEKELAALNRSSADGRYWVPRISLGAQYLYYNNRDNSVWSAQQYRDAYQVGIFLRWNLFDGMSSISRERESAYRLLQAQKTTRERVLRAPQDLRIWQRRQAYQSLLFASKRRSVVKSEEAVRLATEGLRLGSRTSSDLLDAELDLFRDRAGAVRAQLGAAEALINLENALGRNLSGE